MTTCVAIVRDEEVTAAAAAMADADVEHVRDDVAALVDQLVVIRVVDEE